jgi:peptidyl-prolyl cis-trans isomerase C
MEINPMRVYAHSGLLALSALTAAVSVASAQAPTSPPAATGKAAAPAPPQSPAQPKAPGNMSQVLGTVNNESITRGDLVNFLSRYQIPPGNEEVIYRDAMDSLVNSKLVNQFLDRQRIPVSQEKVNEQLAVLEKQLKQDGTDLATELLRGNKSLAEVRKEITERIRFIEYLNAKATDAELKKYVATHRDLFNGTQVRASHVLLKVDPKASAEDKEKLRQKILGIKSDILANKMTFAQAANKYSEDPANTEGAGGDVGYFGLNSGFIEEFANAAFALKKGSISDVVETPYGYHLIQVTDRKEGTPLDFEQNKPLVKQMYANELQKSILTAQRKEAKIDIKPMPADLFPPATVPTPTAAPATSPGTTKGAAAPK